MQLNICYLKRDIRNMLVFNNFGQCYMYGIYISSVLNVFVALIPGHLRRQKDKLVAENTF